MSQVVKVKGSVASGAPATLVAREPAYSQATDTLYIGRPDDGTVVAIGGAGTFAKLASPALTGTPTSPTATNGTNTTQIATTAFVLATRLDQLTAPTADVAFNNRKITGLATPTADADGATKAYVDTTIQGVKTKVADLVTVADLNGAYTYAAGVITGPANTALANIDGTAPAVGDRVLLVSAGTSLRNGLYTVDALGSGASQYQITRHVDLDVSAEFNGALVFVERGGTKQGARYLYTGTANPTIGTTAITFSQISDPATTYTADETSVHLAGNQFSVKTTWPGQTAITTVGTIATGTWSATRLLGAKVPILSDIEAPTASVSLNSQKITNLLDPTTAQDAASKNYVDTHTVDGGTY